MEYASDAYWGDPQRYQFKAMIDSFGFQTELADRDERIVRSTFDIKLNGYIIPDIFTKRYKLQITKPSTKDALKVTESLQQIQHVLLVQLL
jgi:hypothetical protein